jgi:hypothetical protein
VVEAQEPNEPFGISISRNARVEEYDWGLAISSLEIMTVCLLATAYFDPLSRRVRA